MARAKKKTPLGLARRNLIGAKVAEGEAEAVRQEACERGLSVSELIRAAVNAFLRRRVLDSADGRSESPLRGGHGPRRAG